jgi:hypothetical protein
MVNQIPKIEELKRAPAKKGEDNLGL